jgi:hypothetical protein
MQEAEFNETDACVICGEEVSPEDPANYYPATSIVVCYECARQHGGQYDPELERWSPAPRIPELKRRMPRYGDQ